MTEFTEDIITSKKFITGSRDDCGEIDFRAGNTSLLPIPPLLLDEYISITNKKSTLSFCYEYIKLVTKDKNSIISSNSVGSIHIDPILDTRHISYELMKIDSKGNMNVGGITVGTYNSPGKIVVRNRGSIDSVTIDGASGDVILANADCAEDFEISEVDQVDPGTVMTIDNDGKLAQSKKPYDKKVAGVISGAGDLKPGLVLGRKPGNVNKVPIALAGRVNCKVDAVYGSIDVGDLLTTSETPGYAMRASDSTRSFGAVIGKALHPLKAGRSMIPILIALQ